MSNKTVIITPSVEEVDQIRGYRIGEWRQYKNYECVDCQYSTLFLEKIQKHIAEGDHPWAYPGASSEEPEQPSDIPVYE